MDKRLELHLMFLAALTVSVFGQTIRLVSPLDNGVGRLEVYYNGTWGTVCDDDFGADDAKVACRQLGRYTSGLTPRAIKNFGFGKGKIWLDEVNCNGNESSLASCSHNSWGDNDCGHHEDVGIICDPSDITMKLTPNYNSGLLQVFHSGSWGTVCEDGFGQVEASVVCRALGYQGGKVINGNSSIKMWLDDVQCTLLNTDLKDCKHRPWGTDNCSDREAVGVQCFSFPEEATAARLVSSTTNMPGEGVLELYCGGQWGRVSLSGFGVEEATVACRMVGHDTIAAKVIYHSNTESRSVIVEKVHCLGTELSLNECLHYPWGSVTSSSPVVRIQCLNGYLDIRLNSTTPGRGRVEVAHNNVWGTVCRGSSVSSQEAQVVCKMANRPWTTALVTTSYGQGEGRIWLSNVNCLGTETSLDECSHSGWGAPGCSHSSDVGVVCRGDTLRIHLEPPDSVLNVLLGQPLSVKCVVDYSNSPVTSFRWTHSGRSYSGQTFSKTITSESDSGTLTCSIQNVRASTRINVWYPPEVHLEPSNATINVAVGEDLRVQCVVDDANPSVHTFRWSHNGRTSTGSTFLKRDVTKSDQGQLTCTADNGHMMTPGRADVTVNVRYPPKIHLEPNQLVINVKRGGDVTVVCVVDDANPPVTSYTWSHNNNISHGQLFTKGDLSTSDAGNLSCSATNGQGTSLVMTKIIVNTYTLCIHLEPPGSVLNVLLGQPISVRCVVDVSNFPVTSFRWTHGERSYSGQTFSKTITSKSDSGTLTCSVQNVRAFTRINVWYPPEVHLEPRNATINVAVGEDLRVQCVVDDANPSVHTFRWSHNGRTSTGSTFLKRDVTKSDQGQLTCTADNGHMMTPGRADATINVKYPPEIHLSTRQDVISVMVGHVVEVECVVDDANPVVTSYMWRHNGDISYGQTFLKHVSSSDSGNLSCSATNRQGTSTVQTRITISSSLIGDNTVIAIATGSVGLVILIILIILIIIIIYQRRILKTATPIENPQRTAQTPRADDDGSQQMYEILELPSGGAENTYCDFAKIPRKDDDPAHIYDNQEFEDEENTQQGSGTASGQSYGDIQLEMSENIQKQRESTYENTIVRT